MAVATLKTGLILSVCAVSFSLAACGGGGGGPRPQPTPFAPPPPPPPPPPAPPPAPPPPAPPPSSNFDDAEYRRSNAAVTSGAIRAWEAGGRGQNVTVAVVDSGINPDLAEFAGRIHPASQDIAANRGVRDTEGHGSAVSGVIAMNRDGSGAVGVAFESRILSLNTSDPSDCDNDGCMHDDRDIARGIDVARENGARVINISLGGNEVSSVVINAVGRAAAAGIVIVVSAGNDRRVTPDGFSLEIAQQAGNGHVIIAGAMDENGDLASFSNQAGPGAQYYLAALGVRVRSIDQNGTGTLWSGTSFSAPVVSGAAALLASAFPNLSGRDIVELLLTSADDAGAPGIDSMFGNGLLNVGRAFQPRGTLSVAGTGMPVAVAGEGDASEAMGDAGPQMAGVIILDGYSRAFVADLAQQLTQAPRQRPLAQGLQTDLSSGHAVAGPTMVSVTIRRNLSGQAQVGLAQTGLTYEDARAARAVAGFALSRLSPRTALALGFSESGRTLQQRLANRGGSPFLVARDPGQRAGFFADSEVAMGMRQQIGSIGLTVTGERGRVDRPELRPGEREPGYSLATLTADRRIGGAELTLGLSRLAEADTVLGGRFGFAPAGSTSWFLDAGMSHAIGGGWEAQASYRYGYTRLPGSSGLVAGGSLSTDAWSFDVGRSGAFAAGDRLAFRVMQPLRVRSGGYAINAPVSYDYSNLSVGYARQTFSLAPTGREIDFEAAYGLDLMDGAAYLGANAFLRRQPGHIAAMADDIGAALRFSLRF